MRLIAALGGLADDEVRATFNGGIGMVVVVPPAAVDTTIASLVATDVGARIVGEVVTMGRIGGSRYAEGALS
jgi:phosphoribosylformylglycinamidine cyclo-ligase